LEYETLPSLSSKTVFFQTLVLSRSKPVAHRSPTVVVIIIVVVVVVVAVAAGVMLYFLLLLLMLL
jgi:hypothetical protein